MPPLQDDDVLLVGRTETDGSTTNYKITWAMLKNEIQALPFTNTEDNGDTSTSP